MAPKRKTDAAQSSPSKSKEAKVSAGDEEAARVAGTCLVDPLHRGWRAVVPRG
jgi:hypothetical protein